MSKFSGERTENDVARILVLAAAVMAVFAFAYVCCSADESSADGAQVDGTKYFYNQLTPQEKKIVDASSIFEVVEGDMVYSVDMTDDFIGQNKSVVDDFINNSADPILSVMLWERLDYFWLTNSGGLNLEYTGTLDGSGKIATCTVNVTFPDILCNATYGTSFSQLMAHRADLLDKIENVPSIRTSSRLDTVTDIHNYVCSVLEYTDVEPVPSGMEYRNIYDAFIIDGEVVCEGYARAFKALCDYYEIPCILVIGTGVTSEGSEGHMWNYVQMDNDRWYAVDCTWDDQSTMVSTYLLAGTSTVVFAGRTFAEDHIVSTTEYANLSIPSISTKAFVDDSYTVTFLNYDGSEIEVQSNIAYNDTITAPTATYTDDKIGTFTFSNWYPEFVPTVTKDAIYRAEYDIDFKVYTYTFHPMNGETDIIQEYHYLDTVTLPPNPEKAADENFSYQFSSWNPTVPEEVTVDNLEFTAKYEYIGTPVAGSTGFVLTSAIKTALADADKLTVVLKTDDNKSLANITFNKEAIAGFNVDQTLTVQLIPASDLHEAVQSTLETAKIFRIDFGTNNSNFALDGKASVALYYEKTPLDKIAGVTLYYVNGDTLEQLGYNYVDNYVVFETAHFSDYAVKSVMSLTGIYWYIPIIAILIFAIIGFGLAYRYG